MCCRPLDHISASKSTAVVEGCPSLADEPGPAWNPGGGKKAQGPPRANSATPEANGHQGRVLPLTLAHLRQVRSPQDTPTLPTGREPSPERSQHLAGEAQLPRRPPSPLTLPPQEAGVEMAPS